MTPQPKIPKHSQEQGLNKRHSTPRSNENPMYVGNPTLDTHNKIPQHSQESQDRSKTPDKDTSKDLSTAFNSSSSDTNNKIPREIEEKILKEDIYNKLAKKYYDKNEGWTYIPEVIDKVISLSFKAGQKQEREEELEFLKTKCIYCNVARERMEELKK